MKSRRDGARQQRGRKRLYNFGEVYERLRPMGRNQLYDAFRHDPPQIPGAIRIGNRWYAVAKVFDAAFPEVPTPEA